MRFMGFFNRFKSTNNNLIVFLKPTKLYCDSKSGTTTTVDSQFWPLCVARSLPQAWPKGPKYNSTKSLIVCVAHNQRVLLECLLNTSQQSLLSKEPDMLQHCSLPVTLYLVQ